MSIEQDILSWDGKSSRDIEDVYHRYSDDHGLFIPTIIAFISQPTLQKGSSWLLKHCLESGLKLTPKNIKDVYKYLSALGSWEGKLHLLQCLPFMPVAKTEKKKVECFLRQCLMDQNKFVRAWAYNGFYELSVQYPEYKEETKQFFEMAMRDEAASVKARIRNIMKNGF